MSSHRLHPNKMTSYHRNTVWRTGTARTIFVGIDLLRVAQEHVDVFFDAKNDGKRISKKKREKTI